jgi:hypothetical protein
MRWTVPTPTPNIDAILRSPSLFFFLRAAWTARSACAAGVTAARVASPTVPLVFVTGEDPVRAGLVASLDRPEGNLTGVTCGDAQTVQHARGERSDQARQTLRIGRRQLPNANVKRRWDQNAA